MYASFRGIVGGGAIIICSSNESKGFGTSMFVSIIFIISSSMFEPAEFGTESVNGLTKNDGLIRSIRNVSPINTEFNALLSNVAPFIADIFRYEFIGGDKRFMSAFASVLIQDGKLFWSVSLSKSSGGSVAVSTYFYELRELGEEKNRISFSIRWKLDEIRCDWKCVNEYELMGA